MRRSYSFPDWLDCFVISLVMIIVAGTSLNRTFNRIKDKEQKQLSEIIVNAEEVNNE